MCGKNVDFVVGYHILSAVVLGYFNFKILSMISQTFIFQTGINV